MFISFIHDKMYGLFMNGEKMLLSAGLKEGDAVLEVGCGPGFFTLPATKIVGEKGFIYAIDINPFAIKKVDKKIQKTGVRNIKAMVVDVTQTTLEDESVDHTFFFGVIHSLMNILDDTLKEMHRILKFEGTLVIQKSRKSTADIINLVTTKGMFKLLEEKKRILIFQKC
jgi:ubiquinone/menaquinone biosynthesis C-methylase UbiE